MISVELRWDELGWGELMSWVDLIYWLAKLKLHSEYFHSNPPATIHPPMEWIVMRGLLVRFQPNFALKAGVFIFKFWFSDRVPVLLSDSYFYQQLYWYDTPRFLGVYIRYLNSWHNHLIRNINPTEFPEK